MCVRHIRLFSACRGSHSGTHTDTHARQYIRMPRVCLFASSLRHVFEHCTIGCVRVGACNVPFRRRRVRTILRNVAHSTVEEHAANNNNEELRRTPSPLRCNHSADENTVSMRTPSATGHAVDEQRQCESAAPACDGDGCK